MTDKKKNASRSQLTEVNTSQQAQTTTKSIKAPAREERRESATKNVSKPAVVKKDGNLSPFARARNSKFGRFLLDAYYELRHKVTWPTFLEARNMTIAVIIISVVIGGLLSLLDFGLYRLFLLIVGGK